MPQQQPQCSEEEEENPRRCQPKALWIAGATAAGFLLLLLLLAATWGQIDGNPNAASSITRSSALRSIFRRPIASHQEEKEGYDAGLGRGRRRDDEPSSLRRRPGMDRPGDDADDVLWTLEPECVAALYHGTSNDTCGCSSMDHHDSPAARAGAGSTALAFVDGEGDNAPSLLLPAGGTARFTLQSTHECSDVIDAALFSPASHNALHADVTVPARVLALDNGGGYEVSATLPYAGTYSLKAWVLWEGFAPRVACRESPCRRCLESIAPRYTAGAVSRTVIVQEDEKKEEQEQQHPPPPPLPVCTTLASMMDGAWVQNPTLLDGYHDRVQEEEEALLLPPPSTIATAANSSNDSGATALLPSSSTATTEANSTDSAVYARLKGAWVPTHCRLPLYSPHALQAALAGKHLHFIGDSTTREFMHGVMRMLWPEDRTLAHDKVWLPNDYDSGSTYPTRFSFNWVGGPATNDSMQGLGALVRQPQRFLKSLHHDPDFVFLSAGTHDVAGKRSIPEYTAALATIFDWVAARVLAVKHDPRRVIWRSPLPLLSQFEKPDVGFVNGSCRQEHSAALQWMRLVGTRAAKTRGFGVLDAYRVMEAEDVSRAFGGQLPCSRDGMHYAGCDSHVSVLAVYVHHVLQLLSEGKERAEEVECGLASCS